MSGKDYEPFDLANNPYQIHQLAALEQDNVTNAFGGYVDEVLGKINDGKEATVYLCRASADLVAEGTIEAPYLAAKMYRPKRFRNFDNDASYRNFGKMRDRRMAKAMRGKSKQGKKAFHNHWIDSEYRQLIAMHEAGIRVPRVYLQAADGILMDYVGTGHGPAPRLVNCRLESEEAERLLAGIMEDVERMIDHDIVHGDLSAYNILYDGNVHTVIDVPQAVDARTTPEAYTLFQRDLENVGKYFARYGLEVPVDEMMRRYF